MFKNLKKKLFDKDKPLNVINEEKKEIFKNTSWFRTFITNFKNKFFFNLNLRIEIRNLLPNRYPLTSILIALNLYK